MHEPHEAPISSLSYAIEVWDAQDLRVEEIVAAAKNLRIAKAAYRAALEERPNRIVRLRQKAFVVEERIP